MSIWKIYRFENMILSPTMVVTDAGVFIETNPVEAISTELIPELLALVEKLLNSTIEHAQERDFYDPDSPDSSPQSVLLELLKIRRWRDFEKRALMYTLHRQGSELTMYITGRATDGMWAVDDANKRIFSLAESLAPACQGIVDELVSRRPIESPQIIRLGLPPPADANKRNAEH